jgi:DNA-binding MarR family transcriptional regulator
VKDSSLTERSEPGRLTSAGRCPPAAQPGTAATGKTQAAAAELLAAISIVRRTARRTVRQVWHEEPLPAAQSELLKLTMERPGITVADAAQELRLAPNTVSTLVGRLTAAGLLSRTRGRADGRTALLTVTEKARHRVAGFRDLRAELAARAMHQLSEADQRALTQVTPALVRLAERMEASEMRDSD